MRVPDVVFARGKDEAPKSPKTYPQVDNSYTNFDNGRNIETLAYEENVYQQLGSHDGMTKCFGVSEYLLGLLYANQGPLQQYSAATEIY
ncbi:hypothetical protein AJ80_06167 [Polytolypa hystricis UAMH7299]|uniref:Uncharacterized protein n=1 Tax=Polytolypa hystricis (strain UAMH7299) TaxID=1447883 RepID=A0A2B7XZA3_POLH7|nr:hypothetical protein AJ80_06167 [Polytolypa hystricis UAMH7299]